MVEQRVLGGKKEFCSVFVQFHFLKFSLSRVLYVCMINDGWRLFLFLRHMKSVQKRVASPLYD